MIRVGSIRPLPMVAIEAAVNSCHGDLKSLPMHTLDRKGSQKEFTQTLFNKLIESG